MTNKNLKWKIIAAIIYVVIIISFIIIIIIFKWSWWVLFWLVLIPLIGLLVSIIITKLIKTQKKQDLTSKEKQKHLDITSQQKFVRNFVRNNDELADELETINIKPYTPKQEGSDKLTVDIAECTRYWGDTTLFLALSREEFSVIAYKDYPKDQELNNECLFEKEIDKAVLNPQRMIEIEDIPTDQFNQPRRLKRVPLDFIQKQKEQIHTKEVEIEEGAE